MRSVLIVLLIVAVSANAQSAKKKQGRRSSIAPQVRPVEVAMKPVSRTVEYRSNDLVRIRTRMQFTTLLILPEEETVTEVSCGDREFWVVDVHKNLVHVKPAKESASTNLNVISAKGNVYSFVLQETRAADPDIRIVVEVKDAAMRSRAGIGVAAATMSAVKDDTEIRGLREQLERSKKAEAGERKRAEDAESKLAAYPGSVRFPYIFQRERPPFGIVAMFHDDCCTYIQTSSQSVAAVYEQVDGKPVKVDFRFAGGFYTIPKVLDRGYMTFGKQRTSFVRRGK